MKVVTLKCADIIADPRDNVSRGDVNKMNPQQCMELAKSIEVHGLLAPVLVQEEEDSPGQYRLRVGFQRYTAKHIILGHEDIDAVILPPGVDGRRLNAIENLHRKDLTFWEECCMLRNIYPDDSVMKEIQDDIGMSKTWVNTRWKAWNLPDEVKGQIEAGLLGFSDVVMLVQKDVDAVRSAEKIAAAKAAGKTSKDMEKEIIKRSTLRGKKVIQQVMTKCLEKGKMQAVQALRFAIGEIEEKTLINWLNDN